MNPPTAPEQSAPLDASKAEAGQAVRIRISADGKIIPAETPTDNVTDGHIPTSTLETITATAPALSPTSDESGQSEEIPQKRRRRVAVDGPDDIATDIQILALRIAADCSGVEIETAMAEMLDSKNPELRTVAFEAIAKRSEKTALSAYVNAKLKDTLGDPDAIIRGYVARAVVASDVDVNGSLAALVDDPDVVVRSIAMGAVACSDPDRAVSGFRDSSALVRQSALASVLRYGTSAHLEEALGVCLQQCWTDTLAEACARSTDAHAFLISFLSGENLKGLQTQTALDAIACTGSAVRQV